MLPLPLSKKQVLEEQVMLETTTKVKVSELSAFAQMAHNLAVESYEQGHPDSVSHNDWMNQHHNAMLMRITI